MKNLIKENKEDIEVIVKKYKMYIFVNMCILLLLLFIVNILYFLLNNNHIKGITYKVVYMNITLICLSVIIQSSLINLLYEKLSKYKKYDWNIFKDYLTFSTNLLSLTLVVLMIASVYIIPVLYK